MFAIVVVVVVLFLFYLQIEEEDKIINQITDSNKTFAKLDEFRHRLSILLCISAKTYAVHYFCSIQVLHSFWKNFLVSFLRLAFDWNLKVKITNILFECIIFPYTSAKFIALVTHHCIDSSEATIYLSCEIWRALFTSEAFCRQILKFFFNRIDFSIRKFYRLPTGIVSNRKEKCLQERI